ncbi:c-type cytochrome biogenesis protein CcmI [Seminibacterium arietis]|uniref:C-type cytochrome biogenesis protein CcmI n=1 Tax=Seminibacterium arietis TaxID=1173502 RepID=A0ABW3IAJ1_9PAST
MNFWVISLLLTFITALICFYPLLCQKWGNINHKTRDDLNKALYFNRLQEIDDDEKRGLLENSTQLKTELQKTLLQDITEDSSRLTKANNFSKIWFISATLFLFIIAMLSYLPIGNWQMEKVLEENYQKLPHFYTKMQEEQSKPLTEIELQQFTVALRFKLQKHPNSAEDWWTLGQLAMALQKGQLAHDSYAKATALDPENVTYKLAFARVLMFSQNDMDKNQGQNLLKEVLRKDHTNIEALSLLAFQYFEKGEYKMAAVSWAMMLRLLPENDSRIPLIEKSINAAREALADLEQAKPKK